MRKILISLLFVSTAAIGSGITPDSHREKLFDIALSKFWGNAVGRDGLPIEPENEVDRVTLPISKETAHLVFDIGEISGYARWCGVDWKVHFLKLTSSARSSGFSEKQVAFIGVVHGVAQGVVEYAMTSSGMTCNVEQRQKVEKMIENSPVEAFPRLAKLPR
jgi:hypothetical protein